MIKHSSLARIHSVISLSKKIFTLNLECPQIASIAQPGQFVQLKLPDDQSSIWPRPFSIHKAADEIVTISIKKFGKITRLLETLKSGSMINVTGPLGNSFSMPPPDREIYFAAGGVGLPPLQFLAEKLLRQGYPVDKLHFYSGARSAEELFGDHELQALGLDYVSATDDGTTGIKGYITEPLSVELTRRRTGNEDFIPIIYGCGPEPMLKKLAAVCYKIPCFLSLEALMPCGWGVCNGCAVKIKKNDNLVTEDERGFRLARVCKEGPVFDASEVIWE
ncbi:MAG: dihydroorotate dehydrogenase electron transfer subunit [candidate division Zixibacteria bacterium]|nr:dihydroorotate dehydrogenase electron transfer subunit [candidate division Zixibacteria bacterium]